MNVQVAICAALFFLAATFTSTDGQALDFDCRRQGVTCNEADCDLDTKQCNCPDGNLNYLCQDAATNCPVNKYGTAPECIMERAQIDCLNDKMFININPHGDFQGVAYVYDPNTDNSGNDECLLKDETGAGSLGDYVTNKESLVGKRIELSHEGDNACGTANKVEDTEKGETTYTREIFIQYNSKFKSSVDQKIIAKCIVSTDSTNVVDSKVESVKNSNNNFNNVSIEGNVELVQFMLKRSNGEELSGEVLLGDEIQLEFSLVESTAFTNFKLENCKANNSMDGDDARAIDFLTDSCPSADGMSLFVAPPSQRPGPPVVVLLKLTAFMFQGTSAKVAFQCDIQLCTADNPDDCNMPTCTGISSSSSSSSSPTETAATNETAPDGNPEATTTPTPADNATTAAAEIPTATTTPTPPEAPAKRRKRAADTELVATVSTEISVIDPDSPKQSELQPVTTKEVDCMMQTEVLALIIVLAAAVAILLLVVIVCVYQLKTRQWKDAAHGPTTTASMTATTTSPTPVQTFSIPRLEMVQTPTSRYPPSV